MDAMIPDMAFMGSEDLFRNDLSKGVANSYTISYNMRPPSEKSWFRFAPVKKLVISTINHSDIGVINQLPARDPLVAFVRFLQHDLLTPRKKAGSVVARSTVDRNSGQNVHLSIYLSIYPSIHPSIYLSIYIYISYPQKLI